MPNVTFDLFSTPSPTADAKPIDSCTREVLSLSDFVAGRVAAHEQFTATKRSGPLFVRTNVDGRLDPCVTLESLAPRVEAKSAAPAAEPATSPFESVATQDE
jgi:hypothetical protein